MGFICYLSRVKTSLKLATYHCDNLMFIALCETYLTNDILDAEVDIPGFSIVRCDRLDRIGGGVCSMLENLSYLRNA